MATLKPCPVSTDRFTWDPTARTFTAEASDLNGFGRVYDDACDVGLTLVSAHTATEVVFAVEDEERDREGELTCTILKPVQPFWRGAFTMRVYND